MRRTVLGLFAAAAMVLVGAPSADAGPRPAVTAKSEGEVSVQRAFGTWATNVNVRHNNASLTTCGMSPSTANCPDIRGQVNRGDSFEVWCQTVGSQTVGGNPYWIYIITPNFQGWMASYYVDYPDNVLPDTRSC